MTEHLKNDNPIEDTAPRQTDYGDLLSLNSLCEALSISAATGKNWIRLGKLTPQFLVEQNPYFTQEYLETVRQDLEAGESSRLKSRRNKTYISGNDLYHAYVSAGSRAQISVQTTVNALRNSTVSLDSFVLKTLLAECALKLLLFDTIFPFTGSCLEGYFNGMISLNGLDFLVEPLLEEREKILAFVHQYPQLFDIVYYYEKGEDTLGLLYLSLKNIGTRKAKGLYFTPAQIVRTMCEKIFEKNPETAGNISDPCCGTGNFLLQLPEQIGFDQVYGIDTDWISVVLARINVCLRFGVTKQKKLEEHIKCADYLLPSEESGTEDAKQNTNDAKEERPQYAVILGNPPWGYAFTEPEKKALRKRYRCTQGANLESYDLFLERALMDLKPGGVLSFVLPEAFLNVKAHTQIRKLLCENCQFQYLKYLGNVFDKVQCPAIVFQVKHIASEDEEVISSRGICDQMEVEEPERSYIIQTNRYVNPECFSFLTNDEEYRVLEKIADSHGKVYLKDQADFALGIVTGDNQKYISSVKNAENERILRGSDLQPFSVMPAEQYIRYQPKEFQQVAPETLYRAPEKLLYRFISDRLVFSYDDQKTLSLNSCNILIPRVEGMEIKYILAVLNSRMAQYYYEKTFHSMKVLRSHIEQIPIPKVSAEIQMKIISWADLLIGSDVMRKEEGQELRKKIYDRLDLELAILYGLDYREYDMIKASTGTFGL